MLENPGLQLGCLDVESSSNWEAAMTHLEGRSHCCSSDTLWKTSTSQDKTTEEIYCTYKFSLVKSSKILLSYLSKNRKVKCSFDSKSFSGNKCT